MRNTIAQVTTGNLNGFQCGANFTVRLQVIHLKLHKLSTIQSEIGHRFFNNFAIQSRLNADFY